MNEIKSGPMTPEGMASHLGMNEEDLGFPIVSNELSPVALFIGAGASVPLGMPTMVEFRQEFPAELDEQEKVLWNAVVESAAKSNKVSPDKVNIEHMLTHIENRLCPGKPATEQTPSFTQELYNNLRIKILDKINHTYGVPDSSKVVACYDPLFDLLKEVSGQCCTNVFTTNYDLAFEVLVEQLPCKYELADGFNTSSSLSVGDYVPKRSAERSITLYKLHGSTSWAWTGNSAGGQIERSSPQDNPKPALIPPTQHKELSRQPFKSAYDVFGTNFLKPGLVKVLLVIGYGFGDKEIKDEIACGFQAESEATMVIVDPSMEESRVHNLFPSIEKDRIKVINASFGCDDTIQKIRDAIEKLV